MRNYPRIFIWDCCDGSGERKARINDSGDEIVYSSSEEEYKERCDKKQIGKGLKLEDIQNDTDLWYNDESNPDFMLVQIHAANKSFQSKMDVFKGSYMISCFVEQMTKYLGKKTLSKICDSIQYELHKIKKTQHTTNTFNDGCGYLKFKRKTHQ